jgi:transposase
MDGYLDGSKDGFAGRIEVIEGRSGRRRRSAEERARIAAESLLPGAQVAEVARRHGATRWQVYDWRRRLVAGELAITSETSAAPAFAALMVEVPEPPAAKRARSRRKPSASGVIELVVEGIVIRADARVCEKHLIPARDPRRSSRQPDRRPHAMALPQGGKPGCVGGRGSAYGDLTAVAKTNALPVATVGRRLPVSLPNVEGGQLASPVAEASASQFASATRCRLRLFARG